MSVFRKDALEQRFAPQAPASALLLLPRWGRWSYWLIGCACLVALTLGMFVSIPEHAEGPAIIRARERLAITAPAAGVIERLEVAPGEHVRQGAILARFHAGNEEAEVSQLEQTYKSAIAQMLATPADHTARVNVATVRAALTAAQSRARERIIFAPVAGVVSDLKVRPGQSVLPGDLLASISSEGGVFYALALLPGHERPALRQGQSLRLELSGFPGRHETVAIQTISADVMGPAEVRRLLGADIADAIRISGPVVIVQAQLPRASFESNGRLYRLFDGMHATVRARLGSRPLLAGRFLGFGGSTETRR